MTEISETTERFPAFTLNFTRRNAHIITVTNVTGIKMMNASAKEKGNHVVSLARIVRNTELIYRLKKSANAGNLTKAICNTAETAVQTKIINAGSGTLFFTFSTIFSSIADPFYFTNSPRRIFGTIFRYRPGAVLSP